MTFVLFRSQFSAPRLSPTLARFSAETMDRKPGSQSRSYGSLIWRSGLVITVLVFLRMLSSETSRGIPYISQMAGEGESIAGDGPDDFFQIQRDAPQKWIMYNKPFKTGSTTRQMHLASCLLPAGFKVINFNTSGKLDENEPASAVLLVSDHDKLVSFRHGRYSLWELDGIRKSGLYKTCYISSVRDPIFRVPSHAVQMFNSEIIRTKDASWNMSMNEIEDAVCSTISRLERQYLVRYMVGMSRGFSDEWDRRSIQQLAKKVVDVYNIITDETGAVLYDDGSPMCDEARECLQETPPAVNVKAGSADTKDFRCYDEIMSVVNEEKILYNEMMQVIGAPISAAG